MASIIERNIVGLEELARVAAQKLVNIGFIVTHVDNVASTTITPTSKRIVLSAPVVVDAKVDDEPWAIVFEGQDQGRWLSANIVPTQQILSNGAVAKLDEKVEAGRLSTGANTERYFIDLTAWGVSKEADYAAIPFTLFISNTNHGISMHVCIEGMDGSGRAYSWFVCQRGVNEATMQVPVRSPLFCVFKAEGTGNPDELNANEVLRYTVRESDIHAAALPVTACSFAPDVTPIINVLQQVSVTPENNAVIQFPKRINTHRHTYSLLLDMLGYISADIMSADSEVPVTFTGQPERKYLAMNANGANNRGVRILLHK